MLLLELPFTLAAAYVALWASYIVGLPVLAILRSAQVRLAPNRLTDALPNVAVIIPAYNMEDHIARCIGSIQACNYPRASVQVFVVADHCTDDTVQIAIDTGATVLLREEGPRGKTYALAWALDALAKREADPDLNVVVDATAHVDPDFLTALATRWMEGEDIIISRAVVDADNQQWFAQCLGFTLAHRNLQNWARERLGFSAFISGRGMGYSRRYIQRYGWTLALPTEAGLGAHPTEDWRHGVRVAEEGLRASFAKDARVFTPLRGSLGAATAQGIRWERGRITNAFSHGSRLLMQGFRQRNALKIVGGLDAIQPPVAVLVGLTILVASFGALVPGLGSGLAISFAGLLLVLLYGVAVVFRGRREGIKLRTVIWAPIYVMWRCTSFVLALARLDRLSPARRKGKDA